MHSLPLWHLPRISPKPLVPPYCMSLPPVGSRPIDKPHTSLGPAATKDKFDGTIAMPLTYMTVDVGNVDSEADITAGKPGSFLLNLLTYCEHVHMIFAGLQVGNTTLHPFRRHRCHQSGYSPSHVGRQERYANGAPDCRRDCQPVT